jgi:hypothetical protein
VSGVASALDLEVEAANTWIVCPKDNHMRLAKKLMASAWLRIFCLLVFLGPAASKAQTAGSQITGLAILGDSRADEYRADDNRGGAYAATTLNWVELLTRYRGINTGEWGTRSSPRRTGYAFNWALSGATASSLIISGQHTGVAAQVQSGLVSHVLLDIGANDFAIWNDTYEEVYNGSLDDAGLEQKIDQFVADVTTAVDAVRAEGAVKILVVNLADRGSSVAFMQAFPDPAKRQRVTNAVIAINQALQNMVSARPGTAIADLYNFGNSLLSQIDAQGNLHVGSELITLLSDGNEPHHLVIADHDHLGTVGGGLLANFYSSALNEAFSLSIPPFSDEEMLTNAGIGQTQTDTQAPSVSITSPVNNSYVSGTVTVRATATDNAGVTNVQFTSNGVLIGDDEEAPYETVKDTTVSPDGNYTLKAIARDAAGNTRTSTSSVMRVRNTTPVVFNPSQYALSSGNLVSGKIGNLTSDNNSYLRLRSTTSGSTRVLDVIFTASGIHTTTPSSITVSVRAKANAGSIPADMQILQPSNGFWLTLWSGNISTSEATRTATITSDTAQYVDAGSNITVRVVSTRSGSTFDIYYELVKVTVLK